MVVYKRNKLVCGVGINDADYNVITEIDGVRVKCKFYASYERMMFRVYGNSIRKSKAKSVHDTWKRFSKFRSWMEQQEWEGLDLDKDILVVGNDEYGPDVCAFVPRRLNNVILSRNSRGGKYPIGVRRKEKSQSCIKPLLKQYVSRVTSVDENGISKEKALGYFMTPMEAHQAWQRAKITELESAVIWYQTQSCFRTDVADAVAPGLGN